jgi:hypothetical protein
MYDRMQSLSKENLNMIHASSMKVLELCMIMTTSVNLFKPLSILT